MSLEKEFQQYFTALELAGNEDRCFLCRRAPADVKHFFGFHEDGTPIEAKEYGIEDVVIDPHLDIMSYRGTRPICAVCQLNFETITMSDKGKEILRRVLLEVEEEHERLWSRDAPQPEPTPHEPSE